MATDGLTLENSPFVAPEQREWAEAAERGVLFIKRCRNCGKPHYYPRFYCPFCQSAETEFVKASGKGEIYTFTICRVPATPIINAYVTLAEGPTIMTRIVDAHPEDVAIGQTVSLVFEPSSMGFPVPCFRP